MLSVVGSARGQTHNKLNMRSILLLRNHYSFLSAFTLDINVPRDRVVGHNRSESSTELIQFRK